MTISVIGRDGVGKRTFCEYMARMLDGLTLVVDTDTAQATLPVHIKGKKFESYQSLMSYLLSPTHKLVEGYIHSCGNNELFYAGTVHGESRIANDINMQYVEQANNFLHDSMEMMDNIVVDVSSYLDDPFLPAALANSDRVFVVVNPTPEGLCYLETMRSILSKIAPDEAGIGYLLSNVTLAHDVEEWAQEAGVEIAAVLPHSMEVFEQGIAGEYNPKSMTTKAGRKYISAIKKLIK